MDRLSDLARREKLAREMTHRPQAPIESLRGQDPMTDWALGMRERTLNPLATLAGEAQRFQGLSPQEMGMELIGGGIAGNIRKLAGKAAQKTEYELAHELAQRNAALPIEQGGLGLPPNNTAMDRAKAMGFKDARDLNSESISQYWLHGSPSGDIDKFKYGTGERNNNANINSGAVFTTNAPGEADFYSKGGEYGGSAIQSIERGESPTVYPLMISGKYRINPGINFVGEGNVANFTTRGSEKEWAVPADISQIRSRFAAFDPFQRNSANILAGVGAGAVGLPLISNELENMTSEQRLHNYQRGYD